jgi:predicted RNase H-like HicB family nuclease
MKSMAYCIFREEEFYVGQCLNVDVSSFGATREEAVANLKEAVELYCEGERSVAFTPVSEVAVGQEPVNAWAAKLRRDHPCSTTERFGFRL